MAVPLTGLRVDDDERYHRGPIESVCVYPSSNSSPGGLIIPLGTGWTWALCLSIEVDVEIIPWSSYLFFREFNDLIEGHSITGQRGKEAAGTVPTSNVLQAIKIC